MTWARGIRRVFETFCESGFLRGALPTVLGGVVGAGSGGGVGGGGGGWGWMGGARGVWYLLLRVLTAAAGLWFWGGDWALGYVCAQIWDFPNISLFPRILSLKLFGNSYTKFALVDITFRFTCGSSGLY